jgi:serine/threonine protein kinase
VSLRQVVLHDIPQLVVHIGAAQIGSGSFAVVWKATRRADGGIVAIKEINTEKLNAKLRESLESEIAILQVGLFSACMICMKHHSPAVLCLLQSSPHTVPSLGDKCASHEPSSEMGVGVWSRGLQRTHHPNIIRLHDLRRVRPLHIHTHTHNTEPPSSSTLSRLTA